MSKREPFKCTLKVSPLQTSVLFLCSIGTIKLMDGNLDMHSGMATPDGYQYELKHHTYDIVLQGLTKCVINKINT